ncbi:MAG TPA: AAA family ATPase [Solirubrobacteraceae bacterium]|jgi:DNA repair protein RecN (Recombination protein N)|nr:AAA family ATPase [Solirubrobacteraceae bacterium]
MLLELSVENLLLIERARLRPGPGLNVITGETGAGKSVLAHALDLLLAGRPRAGIVRPGAQEAFVEAVFEAPAALPEGLGERLDAADGELVLARRVGADGRTRAYINGRTATIGELGEVAATMIRFFGQHEHRRLTIAAAQLELLDASCGAQHALRLRSCAQAHARCVQLRATLEELHERCRDRERELDLLEHELAEIEHAALDEHEHAHLVVARERMRRLDALSAASGGAAEDLGPELLESPGAAALLSTAAARLQGVAGVDPSLDALGERARSLAIEAQELAGELRAYGDGLLGDGGDAAQGLTLEALEERLDAAERLMRKYGGSLHAVAQYAERGAARVDELRRASLDLDETSEQLALALAELTEHADALRAARQAAAPRLERGVREQLAALGMSDAEFEVRLSERDAGPAGSDAVEFVIAPNPGVPSGPVREIASGGELSRIMLALTATGLQGSAHTGRRAAGRRSAGAKAAAGATAAVAFDELDAGIGGRTARAVGERLRELARARQLLCITHLPQIAALGERHFSIVKDTSASPTVAHVVQLDEPQVVAELVRMLGADSSDSAALRHARDLRRAA